MNNSDEEVSNSEVTMEARKSTARMKSLLHSAASVIQDSILSSEDWPQDLDIVITVNPKDPEDNYLASVAIYVAF